MNVNDVDVAAIEILISTERLAKLKALTGSAATAIELHQETLSLGSSLMNVIGTIEIALRNSVSENLTAFFGTPGWLTRPTAPFQWKELENKLAKKALDSAQRAEYSNSRKLKKPHWTRWLFREADPPTPHIRGARYYVAVNFRYQTAK